MLRGVDGDLDLEGSIDSMRHPSAKLDSISALLLAVVPSRQAVDR